MIIAAAQTRPRFRDVIGNLLDHYKVIDIAAENGADLIVFPEMSITGYELEEAESLAFSVDDIRIRRLKDLAAKKDIIIIAGAPVKIDSDLFIGEFIIVPHRKVQIYTKHFLHFGEEKYYKNSFDFDPIVEIGDERIAFAICADIDHPEHPEKAAEKKATVYIPSIFFSPLGISGAHEALGGYAKKHSMSVLMSNYCGESMGMPAAGRSAFWNSSGEMMRELSGGDTGILLAEKKNGEWSNRIVDYH